jgi:tetratricopeptide (TPR) repeat protein
MNSASDAPFARWITLWLVGWFLSVATFPVCSQVLFPFIGAQQGLPPVEIMPAPVEAGAPSAPTAPAPTVKVGDAAPAWKPGPWVGGNPLPKLAPGQVHVLLFWSADSQPCQMALSHIAGLAQALRDQGIRFAGQVVWESHPDEVAAFIKNHPDWFPYPVALDTPEDKGLGLMARTWLDAAGQAAIPVVFVVDKAGRIAWIGHPFALDETLLKRINDGTFDLNRAKETCAKALRNEPKLLALWQTLQQQDEDDHRDEALRTIEAMEKLVGDEGRAAIGILRFKFLLESGDYPAAAKVAAALSDALPGDAMLQNQMAWELVTGNPGEGRSRDLALLEKIARRATDASWGRDAAILDTLARVLFLQGKKAAAIELQEKAVKLASPLMRPQLQEALDNYRQGKLPPADE